jgi:hypothetical protein
MYQDLHIMLHRIPIIDLNKLFFIKHLLQQNRFLKKLKICFISPFRAADKTIPVGHFCDCCLRHVQEGGACSPLVVAERVDIQLACSRHTSSVHRYEFSFRITGALLLSWQRDAESLRLYCDGHIRYVKCTKQTAISNGNGSYHFVPCFLWYFKMW